MPFEKVLEEVPHVRERLLEMALDERVWMPLWGCKTARQKITSFLMFIMRRILLSDTFLLGEPARLELLIMREQMANFHGLTIEMVSRQLPTLNCDGLTHVRHPLDPRRRVLAGGR